jgi:hypothetical protein
MTMLSFTRPGCASMVGASNSELAASATANEFPWGRQRQKNPMLFHTESR